MSGTSFTQATLDHTTFTGATGIPPWNLYVLIVAVLIFVLLIVGTVRRSGVFIVIADFAIRASGRRSSTPADFGPNLSGGGFVGSPYN